MFYLIFDVRNWNINAFNPNHESNLETENQNKDLLFETE